MARRPAAERLPDEEFTPDNMISHFSMREIGAKTTLSVRTTALQGIASISNK